MLSIKLTEEQYSRLIKLAEVTNRPKSFFIHEVIERSIEDMEDTYLSDIAYEKWILDGKKTKSLEEIGHELELED